MKHLVGIILILIVIFTTSCGRGTQVTDAPSDLGATQSGTPSSIPDETIVAEPSVSIADRISANEAVIFETVPSFTIKLDSQLKQQLAKAFKGWNPENQKVSPMEIIDEGPGYKVRVGDELTIGFTMDSLASNPNSLKQRIKDGCTEYYGWLNGKAYWFSAEIMETLDHIAKTLLTKD